MLKFDFTLGSNQKYKVLKLTNKNLLQKRTKNARIKNGKK